MNVRELHDPETVKGSWQPLEMNSLVLDREHVRLTESRARDVRQAESQGTQRRRRSLGTAVGRDTSALVPSDRGRHIFLEVDDYACRGRLFGGAHYRDLIMMMQPDEWKYLFHNVLLTFVP